MVRVVAVKQCPKVLFTGTHSTGKSSLIARLMSFTSPDRVATVHEVARNCPFELNKAQNTLSTSWLIAAQIQHEIEAQTLHKINLVICDRSLPDILAYHRAVIGQPEDWMAATTAQWMETFDAVFVARPDPARSPAPDPLRIDDQIFRETVQSGIELFIGDHEGIVILPHDKAQRWTIVCAELERLGATLG